MNRSLFIVAGDISGDIHAANLVRALKRTAPGTRVTAIGGRRLAAAADVFLENIVDFGAFGFLDPAKLYFRLKGIFDRHIVRPWSGAERPDTVILVDYYGFNIHVAEHAARAGIPVYYYISPQIWASRAGRLKKLAKYVTKMLVILPFEEKLYRDAGVDAVFVGNPLIDEVPLPQDLPRSGEPPLIGLFPGSRKNVFERHMPVLEEAAAIIRRSIDARFAVFMLPEGRTTYRGALPVMDATDHRARLGLSLAVTTSGTVSLENALMGIPMLVMYRLAPVNYLLARMLVKIPYITMANILAGEMVVPELIQDAATPASIAGKAIELLSDGETARAMRSRLLEIRAMLGEPGVSDRAARIILGN